MYPSFPLTPSWLRLYILSLHLRFTVSKGLAHLGIELFSSMRIYSTRETAAPLRRRSTLDSRPFTGRSPRGFKTSSRRRIGYRLYRPLLTLDLVSHLCVHRSSACVIYSCWLSDFSRVSLVFPLVFIMFFVGIRSFRERSAI